MIPLTNKTIELKGIPDEIRSSINKRIIKRHSFLFESTSTWNIDPEMPMIGIAKENGAIITRLRRPFETLFPKIFTRWTIYQENDKVLLNIKSKLSWTTIFGSLILIISPLYSSIRRLVKYWDFDLFLNDAIIFVPLIVVAILLLKRELIITEKLILNNQNK